VVLHHLSICDIITTSLSEMHCKKGKVHFEVRHPCCVNQITKYKADTDNQNTTVLHIANDGI